MSDDEDHELVRTRAGHLAVRSRRAGEVMHPGVGVVSRNWIVRIAGHSRDLAVGKDRQTGSRRVEGANGTDGDSGEAVAVAVLGRVDRDEVWSASGSVD
jgi:hypothetical protein